MKELSRAEITEIIALRTEGIVLGTAFLFLAAGSLWGHFAMGPVSFAPPFLLCWMLIHVGAFLTLALPRLERVMPLAGLLGVQLHFYISLKTYELPFFPMAPTFFLIATLSLMAFRWRREMGVVLTWSLAWAGAAFWMPPPAHSAFALTIFLNFFFVGSFLLTLRFFARNMTKLVRGLGAHQRFDSQRIQAANLQTLGELAAGLAHEISNPLTAINGYAYQISEDLKSPDENTLKLVGAANDRIKYNVDRVLDISKVMRGFTRDASCDEFKAVSAKEIVRDALLLMKHSLKSNGIELRVETPENDAWVSGSLVQISQIVVNLLANARDAVKSSDRKKIIFGYSSDGKDVSIWVEDTGTGISDDVAKEIFKAFFTTKPAGEGTGLGLYIAGIIAERHKAHLDFECLRDTAGRIVGTRFTLKLQAIEPAMRRDAA